MTEPTSLDQEDAAEFAKVMPEINHMRSQWRARDADAAVVGSVVAVEALTILRHSCPDDQTFRRLAIMLSERALSQYEQDVDGREPGESTLH